MRSFQAVCVALAVASCRAGVLTGYAPATTTGYGYGVGSTTYGTSYGSSYAPASYGVLHSTGYHAVAAPVHEKTYAVHYAEAPSHATEHVSYAVAQPQHAVTYATAHHAPVVAAPVVAAPVKVGVIATAPAATAVKSHEIHTGSGRHAIRIEDYQAGDQVIRVHEGAQAPPQVAQVQVPGEQHHIRVVNHQSGPAQVERVVHRSQTQVIDVQKPGRPGARIVQVVRGESPAPQIEFVNAGGSSHHVYHANEAAGYSTGAAHSVATTYAAPISHGVSYGHVATAPATYSASYSAPVAHHAPVSYVQASYAPVSYGHSYGQSYGQSYGHNQYEYAPSHAEYGSSYYSGDQTAVLTKA